MSSHIPNLRWSVKRLQRAMRDETETSLHHAREAQRIAGLISRKTTLKSGRAALNLKGA